MKLSANVSKEWGGTFEELKHKRDKLQEKLKQGVAEHATPDQPLAHRCFTKGTSSGRYLCVPVQTQTPNLTDGMKAKIDTRQGKQIYARQPGLSKPVFADVYVHERRHPFMPGSGWKVDVQWKHTWFAMVHNIDKIH